MILTLSQKRIACLPTSAEAYRRRALALAGVLLRSAGALVAPRGGYSFDQDTEEAVRDLLAEVIEVIERAPVSYSKAGRLLEEAAVRAEVIGDV